MKKRSNKFLALLLVAVILATSCFTAIASDDDNNAGSTDSQYEQTSSTLIQYLSDLTDDVVLRYKYGVTKETLLLNALKALIGDDIEKLKVAIGGALNNLDEYSHFYTGDEYTQMKQLITGKKGMIGIQLRKEGDQVIVAGFTDNMPAKDSGMQIGDAIISIDGQSTADKTTSEISGMITGDPDTTVDLEVNREGVDTPLKYTLKRVLQEDNPVTYKTIDNDIQYIKIDSINSYSSAYFDQAMDDADQKNIRNIILDLRNDGGGLLTEAVQIVSRFLPKDATVVSLDFKDPKYNVTYKSLGLGIRKYKVVVLVNEYTASACEIISGALKDQKAAYLIGTTTFGKGAVQQFQDLNGLDSAMDLTIAHYKTPNGTDIHQIGIKPDMAVTNPVIQASEDDFAKLTYLGKPKLGDSGDQVLAIKQRLIALGFNLTLNDQFDQDTENAVRSFQDQAGLYVYGVCDITTQVNLNTYAINSKRVEDKQYEYAVDYMKNVK